MAAPDAGAPNSAGLTTRRMWMLFLLAAAVWAAALLAGPGNASAAPAKGGPAGAGAPTVKPGAVMVHTDASTAPAPSSWRRSASKQQTKGER
jgi:hypothetical protein